MKKLCTLTLAFLLLLSASAVERYGKGIHCGKPFIRNISALEYQGHNRNFDIECDTTGRIFAANFEGLIEWDGVEWKTIHTPGISRITNLYRTPDGRVWFGGYNVFGYLDEDDQIQYLASDTTGVVRFSEVDDIFSEGNYVFFDAGDDHFYVNGSEIERCAPRIEDDFVVGTWNGIEINQTVDIPDLRLKALATTSQGVIFVDESGSPIMSVNTDDGLCSDSVTGMVYDGKGSLWGATSNGLFRIGLSPVFSNYSPTDGLDGQVTSILHSRGDMFVGTLQGLYKLNEDDFFDRVQGLDLACWQLAETDRNYILAATAEGLYRYDGSLSQLTSRHTLAIYVENHDSFITGEVDGIYRHYFDGSEVKLNNAQNVSKFVSQEDGSLWAINYYNEAFCMAAGESTFHPAVSDSLSLLFEYKDSEGRLWHSGVANKGLVCYGLSGNVASWCMALSNYSVETMEVYDDVAYVGGNFGVIRMDLQKMRTVPPYAPELYLRSFINEDKNVAYSVAMDKEDPFGTVRYSYKLHQDDKWSRWDTHGEFNFGHLPAGRYNLYVRCEDAFGNTSQTGPVSFKIEAPFYMKWYTWILYVFILGGSSFGIMRYRLYRVEQEQMRLEGLVDERTRELKEAQSQLLRQEREATVGKLTKGLIDRILNPMNYINNFSHLSIGLAKDLDENIEDDKDNMTEDIFDDCKDVVDMLCTNLEKIEQHGLATTRILKAMEELLRDRSSHREETDIAKLCVSDCEVFKNYNKADIDSLGMEVSIDVPSEPVLCQVNPENMSKAVMSILSNAIYAVKKKYAKETMAQAPAIRISVEGMPDGSGCRVIVFDNGIGMEEAILDKIFDPFFTTKPTAEAPGVGLYLSQQVIQDFGGNISAESVKDEFSRIIIELP